MSTTKTEIAWTDRTWNPIRGCSRISPGCVNCYAEGIAARFSNEGSPFHLFADRAKSGSKWTGKVELIESALTEPLKWRKPAKIFVNSMSDLFHENLPDEEIDQVFAVMSECPQHTFQILTKRANRMREYMQSPYCLPASMGAILPNVWLGVSVENQEYADERIPQLLQTPAAVRFVSYEPALGPLNLESLPSISGHGRYLSALNDSCIAGSDILGKLDWVIAGGESGPGARPAHPQWFRDVRDQCAAAGVAFFFKQWGAYAPNKEVKKGDDATKGCCAVDIDGDIETPDCCSWSYEDGGATLFEMRRCNKKAAGALLDGCEYKEFPDCTVNVGTSLESKRVSK